MKHIILISIAILWFSINVFAQSTLDANGNFDSQQFTSVKSPQHPAKVASNPPVIINTIPSPTQYPDDIAYDGENLWVEGYLEHLLFKISPVDGTVIKTIYTNIIRPYGLEFANGFLWVTDADNKLIQQVDTANGNIISSFSTPSAVSSSYPQGLAWDGQNLWLNDAMATTSNAFDSTYNLTSSGQLLQSHHAFGTYVTGLAWDGQYLWSSNNPTQEIYKIDVSTFTVVYTLDAPGGDYPNGLAFDGQYLWVANNDRDSLYQVDISNTNTGISQDILTSQPGFSIYPNPTNDIISVKLFKSNINSTYAITDQSGRQVMNGKLENETTMIDINQLAVGIYILQVDGKETQSFEVIKK